MNMGSYFKPLRRKVGVVTLLLACVLAAAWARTGIVHDDVDIPISTRSTEFKNVRLNAVNTWSSVTSSDGSICWIHRQNTSDRPFRMSCYWRTVSRDPHSFMPSRLIPLKSVERELMLPRFGFYIGTANKSGSDRGVIEIIAVKISYWTIVIPLTLLSAYLLLSRPRVKVTKPASEL